MESAAHPQNESERILVLQGLSILDSPEEEPYDTLTELASQIFNTPIAFVSFVGANRQWFKARKGIDVCETDRSISFCSHTILESCPMVVQDTLKDRRFFDNPLVVGGPKVRFYAGAPIRTYSGQGVGTVCVVDTVPRQPTQSQIRSLELLARLATELLEHRDFRDKVLGLRFSISA